MLGRARRRSLSGRKRGCQARRSEFSAHHRNRQAFDSAVTDCRERAVDTMLVSGRAPVKVRWNAHRERLEFTVIPPLRLIVPGSPTPPSLLVCPLHRRRRLPSPSCCGLLSFCCLVGG